MHASQLKMVKKIGADNSFLQVQGYFGMVLTPVPLLSVSL
jgi:hypothetical protein